jgi:hypothetical protein
MNAPFGNHMFLHWGEQTVIDREKLNDGKL